MRLEDALRWKRALWFLSLDMFQPHSRESWIDPDLGIVLRDAIRRAASSAGPWPAFNSDSREWVYVVLNSLKLEIDKNSYSLLLDWQRDIFMVSGGDRLAEFWWIWICRSFAKPDHKKWLNSEIYDAISLCLNLMSRDSDSQEVGEEMEPISTEWDRDAFEREESSWQGVMDTVRIMAERNSFCEAWQAACSVHGPLFLHEVFERIQVFLEEGNPGIRLTPEELPFPSSWEMRYLKFKPSWQ